MDIAALSMAMAQSDVKQSFNVGMISKSLESAEVGMEELSKAMQAPLPSGLGESVDVLV